MLTYFCGDHINKPVVMIAFGDPEYYDNISLPPSQYDGKHIKEAYMYEHLRDFMKYLKQQSEMKEELECPPVYWIVDLKKNITLWTGLAFKSSFALAIKTLEEYYATELKQSSKFQKYDVLLEVKGTLEVVVEAKNFDDAKHKAQNQPHTFTNEDLLYLSTKAISAMDESKTTHEYC